MSDPVEEAFVRQETYLRGLLASLETGGIRARDVDGQDSTTMLAKDCRAALQDLEKTLAARRLGKI